MKVKIDFALTEFRVTKIVTWRCHLDDSAEGIKDMILCRDILTALISN